VAPAHGEIDVLDPAGYGAVTITKSISIQGHGFSGISIASGATGITINAGLSDAITLNGLIIDGAGVGANGINVTSSLPIGSVSTLNIIKCTVKDFTDNGIIIQPKVAGSSGLIPTLKVVIADSLVLNNTSNGIQFASSNVFLYPAIYRAIVSDNGTGIASNIASGPSNTLIVESHVDENTSAGITITSGIVVIKHSTATSNSNNDISSGGNTYLYDQNTIGILSNNTYTDGTNNIGFVNGGATLTKMKPQ
jgi:hypothetical protein